MRPGKGADILTEVRAHGACGVIRMATAGISCGAHRVGTRWARELQSTETLVRGFLEDRAETPKAQQWEPNFSISRKGKLQSADRWSTAGLLPIVAAFEAAALPTFNRPAPALLRGIDRQGLAHLAADLDRYQSNAAAFQIWC